MGMMNEGDMASLAAASRPGFERIFLTMMATHHNGAIEMAEEELAKGEYGPAKRLAASIRDSQRREVEEMQTILAGILDA
jgi:uncharacterized protein (DUF305 family)